MAIENANSSVTPNQPAATGQTGSLTDPQFDAARNSALYQDIEQRIRPYPSPLPGRTPSEDLQPEAPYQNFNLLDPHLGGYGVPDLGLNGQADPALETDFMNSLTQPDPATITPQA